ncbi:hypothetical protein DB2_17 [Octadecabacter Antarctic DB virus 2]|nr:hypothetical protein DB2_17 [Octadecabacter Antarctic DB virus 2]
MSGGGGKGGSQTSQVEIPKFVENASKANLARANEISQIGYTPYYGPDVASFNPMQEASFANTGQAANAFGMAGGGLTGMEGMPAAQDFNGVSGYSSAPLYQGAVDQLQAQRPGQYDAIMSQFIDPVTGQGGQPAQRQQSNGGFLDGLLGGGGGSNNMGSMGGGNSGAGFSSFGDMFDGGGAGQSGDTFQGGVSNISNRVATPRGSGGSSSSGMGGGK